MGRGVRSIDRSDRIVIGSRRARGTIDRSIDESIGSIASIVTVTVGSWDRSHRRARIVIHRSRARAGSEI